MVLRIALITALAATVGCTKSEGRDVHTIVGESFLGVPSESLTRQQSLLFRSTKEAAKALSKIGMTPLQTPVRCMRVHDAPSLLIAEGETFVNKKQQSFSVMFLAESPFAPEPWVPIEIHLGDQQVWKPNKLNVLTEK